MRRFLLPPALLLVLAACPTEEDLSPIGEVADFTLTDQAGRAFGRRDMAGKVWVVDFFFTRCPSICPHLTAAMKGLAERLGDPADLGRLSITVDMEHDTPEVLAAYAERMGATHPNWRFLTGPRSEINRLALESFKLAFGEEMDAEGNILHSSRFVLVDRRGRVRGYYDGLDEAVRPRLDRAVRRLLAEPAATSE
ncbi:MAG: SCO family protein [Planctomycetota bacterium]|nr:MAG: SCO family protein [Planctomycetota bacterium]